MFGSLTKMVFHSYYIADTKDNSGVLCERGLGGVQISLSIDQELESWLVDSVSERGLGDVS